MSKSINLKEVSKKLLSLDPYYDYSNAELDELDNLAQTLITQYTWPVVYQEWSHYLYTKCPTDEDVVRFAHNYFDYGYDKPIPDPLQFIAYFYYRVNVLDNQDAFDIFDSLAIKVLPAAGLVDLIEEPLYAAETDPRIQAEIENWKQKEIKDNL